MEEVAHRLHRPATLMDLLVVRHAAAGDRAEFAATGQPDELRPITKKGRRRMGDAVQGLVRIAPTLDALASSPLVRARQTAEILSAGYRGLPVTELDELRPDRSPEALIEWLGREPPHVVVAVVGHEPYLSELVDRLLARGEPRLESFKKGAVCLVRFPERAAAGAGTLAWMRRPSDLIDPGVA